MCYVSSSEKLEFGLITVVVMAAAAKPQRRDFNSPWFKQFWALFPGSARNDHAAHRITKDMESLVQLSRSDFFRKGHCMC